MTSSAAHKNRWRDWLAALRRYLQPDVRAFIFLGFAAGLPYLLTGGTLTIWLAEAGLDTKLIGFFAWTSFAYSFKFVWSPVVDRFRVPLLGRLFGHRAGWILLAQILIALGLIAIAFGDPVDGLPWLAIAAVLVSFASATQDIALDAFRIEQAKTVEDQGALSGAYQFGYRIALLVAGAGTLYLAEASSWKDAYFVMAACMAVGMITLVVMRRPDTVVRKAAPSERTLPSQLFFAVVGPFLDFVRRHGWAAILILSVIGLYRLSDFTIGSMAGTLYVKLGFTKPEIAEITKIYGSILSVVGFAIGGALVMRLGYLRALLIGAIAGPASNLAFAWLAANNQPDIWLLALTISIDNAASGIAGTTLIAYMSSLTSNAFTATQYALFSSFYALPGSFLKGFSGVLVEDYGYVNFFVYTAVIGIPAVALVLLLMAVQKRLQARLAAGQDGIEADHAAHRGLSG